MTRRRYTKKEKLSAVMAAEVAGVTAVEEQTGIPKETIHYWMKKPEFAQFRTKTREELQDEIKVVAHLAWKRTAEGLANGTLEPRDALFAAEKATAQLLLMRGEPTTRSENRDITNKFDDHENDWVSDLVRGVIEEKATQRPASPAVEVAEPPGAAPTQD